MAIVKATLESLEQAIRQTNWAAQEALTDEDIARQIADNPDAGPISSRAQSAAGGT